MLLFPFKFKYDIKPTAVVFGKIDKGLIFVFLLSLLPLFNLLHPGLPITHDGMDHIARIANFYKNLTEGNLIPRWAGNLNWGYGHPILMFLYPLPSYLAAIFHNLGFSFIDSFKIVLASTYVLSGIFMYLWLKEFLNKNAAILGSAIYLFAPYRFIDLYVRGDIGEHVAFAFMPLVLFALIKLSKLEGKNVKDYYLGFLFISLSFAALILSHNAISLLFVPIIVFYILYLYLENKDKRKLLLCFSSILFGLLFSFFFWFPAFFEGKYTLRDIVTKDAYLTSFVNIKSLIYGPWSFGGTGQFSVQIGIAAIILTILSIIMFKKLFDKKDKSKYLFLGILIFLFGSIFLMLGQSNLIYQKITILQKLQFPWRFIEIVTFCVSLIGAIFISKLKYKNKNLLVGLLLLLIIIPTFSYWRAKSYKQISDSFFQKTYYGTTDTGESAPIWSVRFMEKPARKSIEVISGDAEIATLNRTSTFHEYVIDNDQASRFRENTLYFPGWKVYDNYKLVNDVEFQDPKNRGLITFTLTPGKHDIILKFENTKLRNLAEKITLTSFISALVFPLFFLLLSKRKLIKSKW